MGKKELENRNNWQIDSGTKASDLELSFYSSFRKEFEKKGNNAFVIRNKPKEFKNIYQNILLEEKIEKEIYQPNTKYRHGISIDFAIDNKATKKTLYIEIKRQDGWVENLPPSAGRGNAHERSCKFFTPGLLHILRNKGKIDNKYLPFWVVFGGNITRDPKRVREITCWFKDYKNHFFMWRDITDSSNLIAHFNKNLKFLLF
jgi:hypothetical protein